MPEILHVKETDIESIIRRSIVIKFRARFFLKFTWILTCQITRNTASSRETLSFRTFWKVPWVVLLPYKHKERGNWITAKRMHVRQLIIFTGAEALLN